MLVGGEPTARVARNTNPGLQQLVTPFTPHARTLYLAHRHTIDCVLASTKPTGDGFKQRLMSNFEEKR